jgi:hypothetical protein
MRDLKPLEKKLRTLFLEGKREHLLTGRSATNTPFAPLARSTLAEPRQSPIPFLKHGPSSSIITKYEIEITYTSQSVVIQAGWPMTWVKYHVTGGPRLPRRNPGGFRQQDKAEAMRLVKQWVMVGNG